MIIGLLIAGSRNLKRVEFENPKGISVSEDFIRQCNDTFELVDLSTGSSYSYDDFIKKFGNSD